MAHEAVRISREMVFNKPHLVSTAQFKEVADYLASRPDGMLNKEELSIARDLKEKRRDLGLGEGNVAVIDINGALTYKETFFSALCGMSSYEGVLSQMRQAVKENYKTVVLSVDSGGGEAYGAFETARELRKLADQNDIKLIAYVDGISASAAYALSVAADEIIINPSAEVGSIGVLTRLVNTSEKDKKEGIETTYIYSGDNKIPFNAEGEWREEFLEDLQQKVDKLYAKFVSHVAELRGISEDSVRSTQAKMFDSEESLEISLADKVMERGEFAEYLADIAEGKESNSPMKIETQPDNKEEEMSDNKDNGTIEMQDYEKLQARLAELEEHNKQLSESAQKAQLKEVESQLKEFSFVGNTSELAQVLFGMEEENKAVVMSVLQSAQQSVEAGATESLVVEDEAEDLYDKEADHRSATQRALESQLVQAKNK